MARQRIRKRSIAEINVVPYIDVMLVLLVIFMITAPLLTQGVKVALPKAPADPLAETQRDPLVLTVDAKANFYLNYGEAQDEPLAAEKLLIRAAAVLRRHPDTPVLVRGDGAASYGDVVMAMTLLQRAGAGSVGLMTRAPAGKAD